VFTGTRPVTGSKQDRGDLAQARARFACVERLQREQPARETFVSRLQMRAGAKHADHLQLNVESIIVGYVEAKRDGAGAHRTFDDIEPDRCAAKVERDVLGARFTGYSRGVGSYIETPDPAITQAGRADDEHARIEDCRP
jgi:hypothetical protein